MIQAGATGDGLVIDADGHAVEDHAAFCSLLAPALRPLAPQFAATSSGTARLVSLEGRPWVPAFDFVLTEPLRSRQRSMGEAATEAGARVRVLDEEGIDLSVIFPSLGLYFGLYSDAEVAAAMCRAENSWLGAWCREAAGRLAPVAVLPQQDAHAAARELELAVERDGAVGGMVRPNPSAGRRVDADDFDVLWRTAADLDVPIVFHEGWVGGGCPTLGSDRARSYSAGHAMSHPFEAMSAMLGISQGGALNRFPSLRLGFFEAGCGWAPWWEARIREHAELRPEEFSAPIPQLSQRVWLTFEPGESGLECVAETGWAANLCFASDFPHLDASYPGAVRLVRKRGLASATLRRLLGDNALALFGPRLVARVRAKGVRSDDGSARRAFLLARHADEVSHSGCTLLEHLQATADVLGAWSARPALRDAGLFHSVYGTEAFAASVGDERDRATVRSLIGREAEELAWLFSRCSQERLLVAAETWAPLLDRGDGGHLNVSEGQFRDLCELTVANWFEQRPRLAPEAQEQLLAAARRLVPFLSPGAQGAVSVAAAVQADRRAFGSWVHHAQRVVTLNFGGAPPPLPSFEPDRVLADPEALDALRFVAGRLRQRNWDNTRGDVLGELALRVPLPTERVRWELGDATGALERTGLLEQADQTSDRFTLAVGLMRLGSEIVVIPGDDRRLDGVYFGFEPLLLDELRRAVAPDASQVLECGAGAGLASLLAARTAFVLATDVLHRASAFVAMTRAINHHLPDLCAATVDGALGLRPGAFDLILANPPHVPATAGRAKPVYSAGGRTGTELPVRILHEVSPLLASGGVLAMLALDVTLTSGARPIEDALCSLGPGFSVIRLLSPWRFMMPGAVAELRARHQDVWADARHIGLLVMRTGEGAQSARGRAERALAQLAGLGWRPIEPGGP